MSEGVREVRERGMRGEGILLRDVRATSTTLNSALLLNYASTLQYNYIITT